MLRCGVSGCVNPFVARFVPLVAGIALANAVVQAESQPALSHNLSILEKGFAAEVSRLEQGLTNEVKTREDWESKKSEYRRQLAEMLGLDPMPVRSDLHPVKTGEFEHEGIMVENWHFQSVPGLYVTANLYRPLKVDAPLPTVLYMCGHANVMKDGVSFGNKAGYEHHGVWYAKNGFVCMVIDTVQLGEIRGEHGGTHRLGRWWWWARGYTPAGVEAWNGIRALDYLETRPEVDKTRFGVTGRSGGGAYSWWIASLDDRIKCAAPTAGITTLRNHVVDGCVSGHCDCMFMQNSYGWDYDKVASLVAPRPLCILNTDKDGIFPLDGVMAVFNSTRRVYKLLGAEANLGIQIAEGGHADTQPLHTGEFHWMSRFLKNTKVMDALDPRAVKNIPMEKLRVFQEIPADQKNTAIDQTFVPMAAPSAVPASKEEWQSMKSKWLAALKDKCGIQALKEASTPQQAVPVQAGKPVESDGIQVTRLDVPTGSGPGTFQLPVYVVHRAGLKPSELDLAVLNVLDDEGWRQFANTFAPAFPELFPKESKVMPDAKSLDSEKKMHASFKWGMVYACPRGVGPVSWEPSADGVDSKQAAALTKDRTHRLRRFYLLGQTLEGVQTGDIRSMIESLRMVPGLEKTKMWLQASRTQAVNTLYASLSVDGLTRVDLHELPPSHMDEGAPPYFSVLRYLDIPQAVALACERTRVIIYDNNKEAWNFPMQTAEKLGWSKETGNGLQLRDVMKPE